MAVKKPEDYKYIRAWCMLTGSKMYYWLEQQKRAVKDDAPLDAVYQRSDNSWVTLKDVKNQDMIENMDKLIAKNFYR